MKTYSVRKSKPYTPGISGSTLKLIALICMMIDHTGVAIVGILPGVSDTSSFLYSLYWIMRLIGRCAFPIYCFLLVEGMKYTHSRLRYALRMFAFCLISEIPFDLALYGKLINMSYQNVFWTLLLGLLMLWGFEYTSNPEALHIPSVLIKWAGLILPAAYFTYRSVYYFHRYSTAGINPVILYLVAAVIWVVLLYEIISRCSERFGETRAISICYRLLIMSAAMLAADLFHTDYSSCGVLTIAFMYIYRQNPTNQVLFGCSILTAFSNPTELASFAILPLIRRYNGTRGLKLKYFFYLAYPLHLAILYIIALMIGLRVFQTVLL